MKQPDINRVRKAQDHIIAALSVLYHIERENTTDAEHRLLHEANVCFATAFKHLSDIIIQEPK